MCSVVWSFLDLLASKGCFRLGSSRLQVFVTPVVRGLSLQIRRLNGAVC